MRPIPFFLSALLLGCVEDTGQVAVSDTLASAKGTEHAAAFRVDCTDDVCESVVAVPIALPEGAPARWYLDDEPLPVESYLPIALESGEMVELRLEVEYEGLLWEDTQFIGRSDLVDVEGGVAGTGYHLIGNVNPIHPNVVTFEDCEDRMVKVAIIGGCFSSGVPFQVFVTDPGSARPQTLADYNAAPAEYDPTPLSLRLGAWSGGRVKRGATLLDVQATWSQLLNGDRLELAVPASAMSRWLLIRANGVVHENPVEVRCEDNRFAVNMDTLYDKSSWVGR